MDPVYTAGELLRQLDAGRPNPRALNYFHNNFWHYLPTHRFLREAKQAALALSALGVKKGDKIGIMGQPSPRWTIADLAIMSIGAVTVPLFPQISDENFIFEVKQTDLKTVFIGGEEPWSRYFKNRNLFTNPISIDYDPIPEVIDYEQFINSGLQVELENPALYDHLLSQVQTDDLATIIYSSGSTGIPKGIEHTHRSLFSLNYIDIFQWDQANDKYLSVLPLAHVFARVMNIITVSWGISVYYFNDLKSVGQACRTVHPTILVVVPRLLEKVYGKMVEKIQHEGLIKGTIASWSFDVAHMDPGSLMKTLLHPVAEKLVYTHLREALGGKLRMVVSGGAALDPELNRFFWDIGVPIYEGWGLTEACPVTVNQIGKVKIGTIGIPIGPLEVKISDNGEILVRGGNVMRGYYKNEAATKDALDADGWLHTGDKGSIDEEGFVKIQGRIREILKTSTGEMIAPVPIEQALCKAPFIDMAIIIADKRKFVSCLLVPDFEVLKTMKRKQEMAEISNEEFLNSPFMQQETTKWINQINEHLNHWEQIHAFRFIPRPLTIADGELTPSMKIVRDAVARNFSGLIDSMYNGDNK